MNNKHPKELYRLSFVAAWERFSYYGTTTLLIAYIVTQLHFKETEGYAILGTFAALAYGLPLLCGPIADRIIGKRRSLVWGCILHFVGLSLIVLPSHLSLYIGLSFFVAGNGFFSGIYKAILGDFYVVDDLKGKDAGYTILFGLCNAGGAIGAVICGVVGEKVSWRLGFAIAAFGALLSLLSMVFGIGKQHGQAPDVVKLRGKILPGINLERLIYILTLPAVGIFTLIFLHPAVMDVILAPVALASVGYLLYISFRYTRAERLKIFAFLIVLIAWVFFLALYEQSSGSFNLFVLRNMDMRMGNITLPGLAINNFLPSFLPAIMTPLMLLIWNRLSMAGREPGTILKIVLGLGFMASFFAFLWWGCIHNSGSGMVPVYFLFGGYILMEFSELCVVPIMYSLTYKLSPKPIAGTTMGVLGIAASFGEYLASKIGSLTTIPEHLTDPVKTLPYYTKIYGGLGLLSLGAALLFAVLIPLLRKLMQELS